MGNACFIAARTLDEEPLAKGMLAIDECISRDGTLSYPKSLTVASYVTGIQTSKTSVVDATGAVLYQFTSRCGLTTLDITVKDANGALLCIAKGKRCMTTASFKVLRPEPIFKGQNEADVYTSKAKPVPMTGALLAAGDVPLYECAVGKIKMYPTTASCEYSVYKATGKDGTLALEPIYCAKKLRSPTYALRIEDLADGNLLGKAVQWGFHSSKLTLEAGAGTDVVAQMLISAFVAAASGAGGAAVGGQGGAGAIGGLAGAGVI